MQKFDCIKPIWPISENVQCLVTTRKGGYSQGKFSSFNLGMHVGDDIKHVNANRVALLEKFHLPTEPVWLNQQHGKQVINLSKIQNSDLQADAAYTTEVGKACVVLTADCLPVLFCDDAGSCVAAAHAGWRGLLHGVLENTLATLPVDTNKLLCWLGPAIGPDRFEVGVEVRDLFVKKNPVHQAAFQYNKSGKFLANLYLLAEQTLSSKGVKGVYGGGYCTYSDTENFFSYRRDGKTGRMGTMIWMKPQ